jgi:hypothetical protein
MAESNRKVITVITHTTGIDCNKRLAKYFVIAAPHIDGLSVPTEPGEKSRSALPHLSGGPSNV